MLLKLKNKTILALDKLLKDAETKSGIADYFVFEPKEAACFIREIKQDKDLFKKHVEIKQINGSDIDVRFLLQSELTKDSLYSLVNRWYKKEFLIFYKNVEIRIVREKPLEVPRPQGQLGWDSDKPLSTIAKKPMSDAPPPPPPPPNRALNEDIYAPKCEVCDSSVHRKWGVFGIDGCINPTCEKYFNK